MIPRTGNPVLIKCQLCKDLLCASLICTLVLTFIILYGNLARFKEVLFHALALDTLLFAELVALLIPYAFSMAFPFGFCVSLLFCIGKWSADRELIALESLGFARSCWMKPVFITSLLVSFITGVIILQLAPIARNQFEAKKKKIMWSNFDRIVGSGSEFNFKVGSNHDSRSFENLKIFAGSNIKRISLSSSLADEGTWQNLRILLWGDGNVLLSTIHAKRASVVKDMQEGRVQLHLEDVDIEKNEQIEESSSLQSSNFIAFRKWNAPIELNFSPQGSSLENPKMMPVSLLLKNIIHSDDEKFIQSAWVTLSKNSVLALSPLFLFPVLISLGISKGRSETSANLFLGLIICIAFYVMGLIWSEILVHFGLGWWANSLLFLIFGIIKLECPHWV